MSNTALATNQVKALATNEAKVPPHILQSEAYKAGIVGLGNEEVGTAIDPPRVKQLQKMSNEVDKHHNDYIEDAEPGDFLTSLNNKLYKNELFVISLMFKHEFVVWKDRDAGGGYGGSFRTAEEAFAFMAAQEKPKEWGTNVEGMKGYDIQPNEHSRIPEATHSHLLLIKNPETGIIERMPHIMDFPRSKLRVSKNWNTQIAAMGGDRFAALWRLSPLATTTKSGEQFLNLNVECAGWAFPDDYNTAKTLYKAMFSTGQNSISSH